MTRPDACVGDYSEAELVARIASVLGPRLNGPHMSVGVGDDAAAWDVPAGSVIMSTDMFCEFEDFRQDWSTPDQVGFKVVVQNVADIVAMGTACTGLLLSLGLPAATPMSWFDGFLQGVRAGADTYDVSVAGGDLSASQMIVVNTTSFGHTCGVPVQRSGAVAGDGVWLSGCVGRSAAGLWLLLQDQVQSKEHEYVQVHCCPNPDLRGAFHQLKNATSALDVSDGLVRDCGRIATASFCDIYLDPQSLSHWVELLSETLGVSVRQAQEWVYTGGEEHVILATFPESHPPEAPFVRIGSVTQAAHSTGQVITGLEHFATTGFDHFG